ADILQLIGHQTKTGRLTLKTGADEVEVFFVNGNVVFASEKARDSRDLLGSLLLRAELLSKERLDDALAIQQRTLKRLGGNLVYKLATFGKNVQQILDISRLGEFEALKALNQLIEWEYLRAVPAGPVKVLAEGIRKGRRLTMSWAGALVRLAITLTCFGATLLLVRSVAPGLGTSRAEGPARRGVIVRLIARDQVARLESALEVYRTEHGEYPPALRALLEGELVSEHDLRYPWKEPYYYRRTAQGFVLLPPL